MITLNGRSQEAQDREPSADDRSRARTGASLTVRGVTLSFGGLRVLDAVTLDVAAGENVALIGPNGAGKTSLLNCISGAYTPSAGTIRLGTADLLHRKMNQIASCGLSRTFQNVQLMKNATVYENIVMGAYSNSPATIFRDLFPSKRKTSAEAQIDQRARDLMTMVGVRDHADDEASALPFGIQKRVELARALMPDPDLLLLDEPANGLNPTEASELTDCIRRYTEVNPTSLLVIEHNMKFVREIASRVYCLDFGSVVVEGSFDEVTSHPNVRAAYLGSKYGIDS